MRSRTAAPRTSRSTRARTPAPPRRSRRRTRGTASSSSRVRRPRSRRACEERFQCTPNNWPNPSGGDQRYAYIILTGFGRTGQAANNDWLPIEGLLRVYVTGWDESGGGGGPANCSYNDDPPRGYDSQGAQLWGHLVEPITLDPAVIVADGECDLTNDNIQCSPRLVR